MEEFFHVLNRGVDKRKVFMSSADYTRFIHDMWEFNDTHHAYNAGRKVESNPHMIDVGRQSYGEERLVRVDYLGEKNFPSVTDRLFFLRYFNENGGYARSVSKMLKNLRTNEISGVALE